MSSVILQLKEQQAASTLCTLIRWPLVSWVAAVIRWLIRESPAVYELVDRYHGLRQSGWPSPVGQDGLMISAESVRMRVRVTHNISRESVRRVLIAHTMMRDHTCVYDQCPTPGKSMLVSQYLTYRMEYKFGTKNMDALLV